MSLSNAPQFVILAHCTYTANGIRQVFLHEVPRLPPLTAYMATATVVQRGRALASMIFRSDMPLTDPQLPMLVARAAERMPVLGELLDEDRSRAMMVDPVDHRNDLPRFPAAGECREILLQAFLRHASAGAA